MSQIRSYNTSFKLDIHQISIVKRNMKTKSMNYVNCLLEDFVYRFFLRVGEKKKKKYFRWEDYGRDFFFQGLKKKNSYLKRKKTYFFNFIF